MEEGRPSVRSTVPEYSNDRTSRIESMGASFATSDPANKVSL